jgi:diadenylate cyclase
LSDESDALVIVVSEERGTVSIAERGRLFRDLAPVEVRAFLEGRAPVREAAEAAGASS